MLATTANCADQVRVWISADGLPAKHRARLVRLRAMNPGCGITLVVSRQSLTLLAGQALDAFASMLDIDVCDVHEIEPTDSDERVILEHVGAEIRASFSAPAGSEGNLSVVSDYLRLLDFILQRGLCTDMDVEFVEPFAASAAELACPLGVVARLKRSGCVSNDVTAGVAQSPPLVIARRNVAIFIRTYREAACRYLVAQGFDLADANTVSNHPQFFALRNRQHDETLSGAARFSLTGGPDNFAISLHEAGIYCGFERDVTPGLEAGELVFDHVPHILTADATNPKCLRYEPFSFGMTTSAQQRTLHPEQLWPTSLPGVVSHWDHSWIADHREWRALTYREQMLLTLSDGPDWSLSRAASLVTPSPVALCPVRPSQSALTSILRSAPARQPPLRTPPVDDVSEQASPCGEFRLGCQTRLAQAGSLSLSRQFVDTGIVAVQGLIDDSTLDELRSAFAAEVARKAAGGSLQQIAFNLAVDECDPGVVELFRDVATADPLTDIVSYYLGGPAMFVSARGYRQAPCKPLRYRAWDYHQDMKTNGPFEEVKVMLLLTDVPTDGQAMRYACGTQALYWRCRTQQETKLSLDEALEFGQKGLFVAHGQAGTCVLFDTNGIHAGTRNLSVTRDVITMNYTRAGPNAFFMFNNPVLTRAAAPAAHATARTKAPAGQLRWRSSVVSDVVLMGIRDAYGRTPGLEDIKPRWAGDALQLVDVVASDLNVDLDLRLAAAFKDDRARDIGLVGIRDSPVSDVQYTKLMHHLTVLDRGGVRCLCDRAAPLTAVVAIGEAYGALLSAQVKGDDAENCAALLCDLNEAVVRCDSMQRLRTTMMFLYFATAWAQRLLAASELETDDTGCRELLHLYVHLVAAEDLPPLSTKDGPR